MLRKPISLLLAAVTVAVLATLPAAALPPGAVKDDYKDIMPLSQVRAGMKGYGLTVFRGTKIERFNVEVIGVLRKINSGKDLILTRMSGGPITERKANIMQGMSGSPVYINGKIIGAVAYGPGNFSKDPLAMLTPIEDMLDSLDPKLPAHASGLSSVTSDLGQPLSVDGKTINKVQIKHGDSATTAPSGTLVMTPLMTPVMVSGMSQTAISKLAEALEPLGLQPMAGPGGNSAGGVSGESIQPGSAFGLSLANGDIDMTAIGTVTYRRGNKIVGFGHPMMSLGPLDAPLTTAYIFDSFPSYQVSSKIAAPLKVVGRIFQDRPWSVGGEVGVMANTIPVVVDVNDLTIGRKKTLRTNVINHPTLVSRVISAVVGQSLTQVHGLPVDAMAKVRTEITADQVGKIVRDNVYFDQAIEDAATGDLSGLVGILTTNKFAPVDIKSVHLTVTIQPGHKTASIERVLVDKASYAPGDTINMNVELRPYKEPKFTKTISLKIPENIPDGRMTLQIKGGMGQSSGGGGGLILILGGGSLGSSGSSSGSGSPDNVKQMIDKYLEKDKNNDLVARLTLPGSAVSINGEKLSGLPDAIAGVMKSPRVSSVKTERDEIKSAITTDYILTGEQSVSVKVERIRHGEKRQPSAPSGPSEPSVAPAPTPASVDFGDDGSFDDDFAAGSLNVVPAATEPKVSVEESPADAPAAADAPKDQPAATDTAAAPKAEPKQDKTPAEKTVVRQPSVWKQDAAKDFALGTFNGTTAATSDEIRMVQVLNKLADLPELYAWTVIPDGQDGAYAGTGNNGNVYRVKPDGTDAVLYGTGQLEVHSLARDSKGNVYAGTSPNGKIFRIAPDGNGTLLYTMPEKYVLALAVDSKDNIYAASGDAGKVYQITPDGKGTLYARVNESSVLALAVDKNDNLYAGTARDGVVYRLKQGSAVPLYNAAEDTISSLAADSQGNVYAGTGTGKGNIYKISPTGSADVVYDKAPHALSMAVDKDNNVYVASDEQVVRIAPDKSVVTLDSQKAGAQFVSVAVALDGAVLAGTANSGSVYTSKAAVESTYESAVRDAGAPARWGTISWLAQTPAGSTVQIQTRTGNIAEPDTSWSVWSAAYRTSVGQNVTSPAGRYIQYRVTMNSTGASPAVDQVSISYMTENKAPKVAISDPQAGAIVSRNQTIKWSGSDPDKDNLTYDIYYSADNGATWKRIGSGVNPDKPAAAAPKTEPAKDTKPADPKKSDVKIILPSKEELMTQLKTELDKHNEIPQDVKDKMVADAPAAIEKSVAASADDSEPADQGPAAANASAGSTKQTAYSWDTTKVADGNYMIKVVASDRVSNASGFLTDEKIIGPVTVANTPPKITVAGGSVKINGDGCAIAQGAASCGLVPLTGVQFRVDNGDWMAASSADGLFDTLSESFTINTDKLEKGKHTVEVKAIDAAGNSASAKTEVNVP